MTAAFKGGVRHFFSGIVEKFVVHFGLYYFSLHLKRREEQIDTVHGKKTLFSICEYLVWRAKVSIYFEKKQCRMLVVFPPIFVAATKLIYGYNFVDPVMVILVNFIRSFPLINNLLINAEVVLAD